MRIIITRQLLITFAISLMLASCGGGGGSSTPNTGGGGGTPTVDDSTPNTFSFATHSDSALASWIESAAITISGINIASPISIANGEYRINSGGYTASAGTVVAGSTVTVRVMSPSELDQSTAATLTVGGINADFVVNTGSFITRESNLTCLAPQHPEGNDSGIQLTVAFPNIAIDALVGLYQSPGDSSRWYALSQKGRVYWFDNSRAASQVNDYADFTGLVRYSGEQGLLGMAFDPQYATNGRVYFSYVNRQSQSVIVRLTHQNNLPLDVTNATQLLTLAQPASNHNGGHIAFGPDGYLYIGFGDGGGSGDTYNNGQNTQSLHGTIMRVDVSGDTMTVPDDNPFVGNSAVLDEIYAYGLRNPWRYSFDSQTGDLWLGDVGQDNYEEIDIVKRGDNLGWPIMEGYRCYDSTSCDMTNLTLPVDAYNHISGDCSVTGGYVYRGQSIPALQGHYIHGDFCTGTVRTVVKEADESYSSAILLYSGLNIASFAQGADGEVLAVALSGQIYKFIDDGATSNIPAKLSDTGCFSSTHNKSYPDYVVPYDVVSKLWSDGEHKSRYFAIPDGTDITVLDDGDFAFPNGSVLIKNFISQDTYLETRLMMKHDSGWAGYSYRWLDDQSDAELVDGTDPLPVTVNNINHTIPSKGQCVACHTSAANGLLGPEASQFDFAIDYPHNIHANQLTMLTGAGFLDSAPTTEQTTLMRAIDDESASLAVRARSYLHSNCSGCHRPGAGGGSIDLRVQTNLPDSQLCEQSPSDGDLGIINAKIVALGDSNRSVLVARMQTLNNDNRMPPMASTVVDEQAVAVISQWINNLTDCE